MILQECSQCHKKQAIKNRLCDCGGDLVKLKKGGKVRFWIQYRLPGGKQRKESVGFSLEEAKDAEGKRRSQKRENRIFDMLPEAKMTILELSEWYLSLAKIQTLAYYDILRIYLNKFNSELGHLVVSQIKPVDLENLQAKRKAQGYAESTIDREIGAARGMVNKAFDNDMVGGDTLKVFKKIRKLLKRNCNVRDRVLTKDEFDRLVDHAPRHLKSILLTAFYTGMRQGEILSLTWNRVDMDKRLIHLDAENTKDRECRQIPVGDTLYRLLRAIPRAIHYSHVFLYKGKPMDDLRTGLTKACKAAGLPYGRFVAGGFVFHDLRHTFNTNMRKAGVPESVIMEITGHSTREMFDRYNTVDHDDKRLAIGRLQRYLKNVTQDVTHTEG
jgi:integrase